MKAVILNSGTGSRMGQLTCDKPKCLIPITDSHTLLSRQISQLLECGYNDILITTGPHHDMVVRYVKELFPHADVHFIHNNQFATTNYIYTMHLADALLRNDILLMHGDLVCDTQLLKDFLSATHNNSVMVDIQAPLPEKDFKCRYNGRFVEEIGVHLPHDTSTHLLLPLYLLSASFMHRWMDSINNFIKRGDVSVYAENAFNVVASQLMLNIFDIKGRFCREIDTIEDLRVAQQWLNG